MKQGTLQWFLYTVGGAIVGAIAVDYYRKHKADKEAAKAQAAKLAELAGWSGSGQFSGSTVATAKLPGL